MQCSAVEKYQGRARGKKVRGRRALRGLPIEGRHKTPRPAVTRKIAIDQPRRVVAEAVLLRQPASQAMPATGCSLRKEKQQQQRSPDIALGGDKDARWNNWNNTRGNGVQH